MKNFATHFRSSAGADHAIKIFSLCYASNMISCQNEKNVKVDESISRSKEYKKPTMTHHILHRFFRRDLPTPRLLMPSDPIFQSTEFKKCLKMRNADEKQLGRIQKDLISCVQAKDRQCVEAKMQQVNEVLYGKGVTMQSREEFLVKYGCTPYDDNILDKILSLDRPIIDIGAGNGQWSRALSDRAKKRNTSTNMETNKLAGDHVVAYDNQSAIPLNTEIYHKFTKPAKEFFYKVQDMDGSDAVKLIKNRGRILLLVYPGPGPMAIDIVKSYAKFPENDLVVFVGEGIGGANGNDELFQYWKSVENGYGWILLYSTNVPSVEGGGKGGEKVFIFKKVKIE